MSAHDRSRMAMLRERQSRRAVANRLAEIIDHHGDMLGLPLADKE